MAVTPNYGWPIPVATDYVKDGYDAIADLGNAIDTTVAGVAVIKQVLSTTKTDTYSMSSTTFTDVTGLTLSITPTSASSKILIIAGVNFGNNPNNTTPFFRFTRAGTAIAIGDTASNRTRVTAGRLSANTSNNGGIFAMQFLDSPATTSATTYAIQVRTEVNGVPVYINRSDADTDNSTYTRSVSSLTLMEVV